MSRIGRKEMPVPKGVEVKVPMPGADLGAQGPQFLQAFGLALRGL